jgi:hypothetical protein
MGDFNDIGACGICHQRIVNEGHGWYHADLLMGTSTGHAPHRAQLSEARERVAP